MKIIGINGSPRDVRSQTLRLVKGILDGAKQAGADTELVDVCALRIEYCIACDNCHRSGACIHKDDFTALRTKIMAADGVVLGSPDYFRGVTAQLKTLIDRMADVIHCQLLRGKYACCAATAGGPAVEEVTAYLHATLLGFGASVVGSVSASLCHGPEAMAKAESQAAALGRDLVAAIASKRAYPDQDAQHRRNAAYFRKLVEAHRERWGYEHEIWMRVPPT